MKPWPAALPRTGAGYLQMVGKREGLMLAAAMLGGLIEEDQPWRALTKPMTQP